MQMCVAATTTGDGHGALWVVVGFGHAIVCVCHTVRPGFAWGTVYVCPEGDSGACIEWFLSPNRFNAAA